MKIYYTGGFRVSHVAQAVLTRAGLADFLLRHLFFTCLVSLAYNKYFPLMCIWQVIHRLVLDVCLLQVSLQKIRLCPVNYWWLLRHSGKWLEYLLCPNHSIYSTVRRVPICLTCKFLFLCISQCSLTFSGTVDTVPFILFESFICIHIVCNRVMRE